MDVANALFDFIFYGVLERYPKLRLVTVENESGWLPFMVQQWDYYYRRFRGVNPPPIAKEPGEYVRTQIFSCFFNDSVCGAISSGGARTISCGQTIFPTPTRPGRIRSRSSGAISATAPGDADESAGRECMQAVRHRHVGAPAGISRRRSSASGGLIHRLISAFLLGVAASFASAQIVL